MPMVIRWPGHIQPGTTCEQTMCLVDFFATFAQLTGYQIPDNAAEDSVSILPLMEGSQEPIREATVHHSFFWLLFHPQGGLEAGDVQRLRRWHPAQLGARGGRPTAIQLYHLSEDIGETKNVYQEYPEKVEELKQLLTSISSPAAPPPALPRRTSPARTGPAWSGSSRRTRPDPGPRRPGPLGVASNGVLSRTPFGIMINRIAHTDQY